MPHDETVPYLLHQNIQDKFNEAGIEIMSPHYMAVRDGNETTTPKEYQKSNNQSLIHKLKSII